MRYSLFSLAVSNNATLARYPLWHWLHHLHRMDVLLVNDTRGCRRCLLILALDWQARGVVSNSRAETGKGRLALAQL